MELNEKKCVPCEGGAQPLVGEQIHPYMELVQNWSLGDGEKSINRNFKFKNFIEVMKFVNSVAELAEDEGHHPDICLGYDYVKITLMTHAIKGLSENDFIVAAKINNI